MDANLLKYQITPRILKADCEQVISVKGLDSSSRFYDDVEYVVTITAKDRWEYDEEKMFRSSGRKCRTVINCHSENGVLSFRHFFTGEGEWKINIARVENVKRVPEHLRKYGWKWKLDELLSGFSFFVYSLNGDLYAKRPYKGDLHIHTCESDGGESPELVAAQYRKLGFDVIAITDHFTMAPSLGLIESLKDVPTRLKALVGEEIHPIVGGQFHVVALGGKASVNEVVRRDAAQAEREVLEIAKGLDYAKESDRVEIAWYKWITDEVHKAGGISVYPHPYWIAREAYSVRSYASKEILENRICDVYEILGGTDKRHNRLQAQLYYEMQAKGIDLPIVASSDSHSALVPGVSHFNDTWTMVFAEDKEQILDNIMAGNSVGVDNFRDDDKNVYGKLRLCEYAWFLLDNYYPLHDELCSAVGQAMVRYVQGDETQRELVGLLEKELDKLDDAFFANR